MEKTVSQSYTEQIQIIMPADINGAQRLFGGRLAQWIDVVAAVTARRHSGHDVTTARIDTLEFTAPAHVGETVILTSRVVCVGRSSMLVRVDSFVEELSGERRPINKAYLIMVAIDKNERPVEVPRLITETDEEREEYEKGMFRLKRRSGRDN